MSLGFRTRGRVPHIKQHGCREGAGEGAGAEVAPGLPLWGGGGCWEPLLPPRVGKGRRFRLLARLGQAGHGLLRRLGQGAGGAG